jgi:dihydroflavonol-4-reductase
MLTTKEYICIMILVTGGTGLVGAHLLIHLIENGESVRSIYRNQSNILKTKNLFYLYKKDHLFDFIQWLKADILDISSLKLAFTEIQTVYHCAALISFDPKEESLVRKTNIEGTANIVNFCIANNIKKLCYLSSIAALGDLAAHETIITEKTEWNPEKPHSDYAISKYGAEMEVWRGLQEGLEVIILNPGVILGPGFGDQGSGVIFSKVAKGIPFYTLGTTGFIAVDDVVCVAYSLMKSEIKNDRFTLIAQNIVFRDLINSIATSLHVKKPSVHLKPIILEICWRIDWFFSTFFGLKRKLDGSTAKASYSKNLYSNEKIKKTLTIQFLDIHDYIMSLAKYN